MRSGEAAGVTQRPAARFGPAGRSDVDDVAVEEPLEIRVAGDPLAITMRTPGDDRELALGFLYAEGVIASVDDVGSAAHCGRIGEEGFGNVIDVLPGPGTALAPERIQGARRGTVVSSACGVCGRLSIDDLAARCMPLDDTSTIDAATSGASSARCAAINASSRAPEASTRRAFRPGRQFSSLREDIGRHNAVDKVVGHLVLGRALPAREPRARRERPRQLRDRAKGRRGGHPHRGQRFGRELAGHRSGRANERHAGSVRARRRDERVFGEATRGGVRSIRR